MDPYVILLLILLNNPPLSNGKGSKLRPTSRDRSGRDQQKFSKSGQHKGQNDNKLDPLKDITNYLFRNASSEEKLLAFLFQDYEPVARAVVDTKKTVEVSIDFVLLRIHGLDERSQVLTTTGLVIAEWTDERLTWDPEVFGNLTSIIIKAEKIWLPELALMNGADELMPDFERIRVLLHSDGKLHWEPGGIFRTTCDIDIAYFPFDSQNCLLLIGAYSYYSTKMNITNASSSISTHEFKVNGEWHVHRTMSQWNITMLGQHGDGYSHVVFTLNLRRRFKFYIMNIVLPCVMLSVLIMVGFCLPPDAGEKISLGISVLLAFTVFLLMIADTIPRTSLAIPLIVTYLMVTMTLGTVSVCMTVLVLNVHHRGTRHRAPSWLATLVLVYLSKLVFIQIDVLEPKRHTKFDRSRKIFNSKQAHIQRCNACCRCHVQCDNRISPVQIKDGVKTRPPSSVDDEQHHCEVDHETTNSVWMKRVVVESNHLTTTNIREATADSTDEKDSEDEKDQTSFFCSFKFCNLPIRNSSPPCLTICCKQKKLSADINYQTQHHHHHHHQQQLQSHQQHHRTRTQTAVDYSIISDINKTFHETQAMQNEISRGSRGSETWAENKSEASEEFGAERIESEWHEIARVLDRGFFWMIFIMMSASTGVILFYPKYSNLPEDDN